MITPPGNGSDRSDNLIYFPRQLSPRTSGSETRIGVFKRRNGKLNTDNTIVQFHDRLIRNRRLASKKLTRPLQNTPTSEEGRHYIKTQYIRQIAKAMRNADGERLYTLYGKFSFRNMRPCDKLTVALEVIKICGLELIGGNPTSGLSICFREAFRNGFGTRQDVHEWIRLVCKSMKIRTLERFSAAKGLNDEVRAEANAILINSYIRAAEDMCLLSRELPQDSHRLDHLVEKSITILARLKPTDKRLKRFADRLLRINRIRSDFSDDSNVVHHLRPRFAKKDIYHLQEVEISLSGL